MITEMIGKPDPYVKFAKKFSLPLKKNFLEIFTDTGLPVRKRKKAPAD